MLRLINIPSYFQTEEQLKHLANKMDYYAAELNVIIAEMNVILADTA
ncbi:MAG: hypothetical protein ACJAT1_002093 [Marivirga sp.]|jgi:hypothetical protein